MDNRPIGFLDSGVGGLTVVRELLRQLPHEDVVYIGDSARAPYGPRPADQIREYTWQMVNFLLTKNVKMIVLACNTATAVVWEEVKEKLDIPVLGVILPGASGTRHGSQQFSLSQVCSFSGIKRVGIQCDQKGGLRNPKTTSWKG